MSTCVCVCVAYTHIIINNTHKPGNNTHEPELLTHFIISLSKASSHANVSQVHYVSEYLCVCVAYKMNLGKILGE